MKQIMNRGKNTLMLSRKECPRDLWHKQKALIVCPNNSIRNFGALLQAYRTTGIDYKIREYDDMPPSEEVIAKVADGYTAVLLIGPGRRSPSTLASAPFLTTTSGEKIPLG